MTKLKSAVWDIKRSSHERKIGRLHTVIVYRAKTKELGIKDIIRGQAGRSGSYLEAALHIKFNTFQATATFQKKLQGSLQFQQLLMKPRGLIINDASVHKIPPTRKSWVKEKHCQYEYTISLLSCSG